MIRDYIISKSDKDKFYRIIVDKDILGIHGGIIGEYDSDKLILTLLPEWVPYLDEYNIKYELKC